MPVKPPLFMKADVKVVAERDDGNCRVIATIEGGVQVVRRRNDEAKKDEELFVLTVDCVGQIVASLQQVYERLNREAAEVAKEIDTVKLSEVTDEDKVKEKENLKEREKKLKALEGKQKGFVGKIGKVDSLCQAYGSWAPLVQKLNALPSVGTQLQIDPKMIWVLRNAPQLLAGPYTFQPPIVLHLKTTYPGAVTAGAPEVTQEKQEAPSND
jgi:hypothetical protein